MPQHDSSAIREFDAVIEHAWQTLAADGTARDEDDAELWAAYADSTLASPQWRQVAERVSDGEFTWLDVALGTVSEHADVKAAIAADREAYLHTLTEKAERNDS